MFDLEQATDHAAVSEAVQTMRARFPFLRVGTIGRSIMERELFVLTVGSGRRQNVYVGAHHGMEWLTSAWLLRFAWELCEAVKSGKTVYGVAMPTFCERFTLHIIPMLNPDGVDYQLHGIRRDDPLYGRVIGMNGGSTDLSRWQANARGVDLNHNYDAGFADYKALETASGILGGAPTRYAGDAPCSEPETRALCGYLRSLQSVRLVASFHTQGEVLYYRSGGACLPGGHEAAMKVARATGYRLSNATGMAAYGGLTDYCLTKCGIPAITLECGKGTNPLPLSQFFPTYARLREALFRMCGFYA